MDISEIPRTRWTPLPHEGCVGVEGKVLLRSEQFAIAMLRFGPEASL